MKVVTLFGSLALLAAASPASAQLYKAEAQLFINAAWEQKSHADGLRASADAAKAEFEAEIAALNSKYNFCAAWSIANGVSIHPDTQAEYQQLRSAAFAHSDQAHAAYQGGEYSYASAGYTLTWATEFYDIANYARAQEEAETALYLYWDAGDLFHAAGHYWSNLAVPALEDAGLVLDAWVLSVTGP